jgi:hypothetical protein
LSEHWYSPSRPNPEPAMRQGENIGLTRRQFGAISAWSAPILSIAIATPAAAASVTPQRYTMDAIAVPGSAARQLSTVSVRPFDPLVVRVRDEQSGAAAAGQVVQFIVASGPATIEKGQGAITTDVNGIAVLSALVPGTTAGAVTVVARVPSVDLVVQTEVVSAESSPPMFRILLESRRFEDRFDVTVLASNQSYSDRRYTLTDAPAASLIGQSATLAGGATGQIARFMTVASDFRVSVSADGPSGVITRSVDHFVPPL